MGETQTGTGREENASASLRLFCKTTETPKANTLDKTVSAADSERIGLLRERPLITGGEAGIRTLGTAFRPYNGLANRRLQPLGHLTARL
jgi:hypothetical protein